MQLGRAKLAALEPSHSYSCVNLHLQMCGDIRTLYTGRKHDGFVLITYFDGHGGNFAKAAMQGKQLMGRAIHIELSQPGQNAHDKDTQAGEQAGQSVAVLVLLVLLCL